MSIILEDRILTTNEKHIEITNRKQKTYYDNYYLVLNTLEKYADANEYLSSYQALYRSGLKSNSMSCQTFKELYCNGLIEIAIMGFDKKKKNPGSGNRGPNVPRYKITEKGRTYIARYKELRKVLTAELTNY